MKTTIISLFAFTALFLATAKTAAATNLSPQLKTTTAQGTGPATCNCTKNPTQANICHTSETKVRIGPEEFSVSTSHSSSNCTSTEVPSGSCVYIQYNFECRSGWFGWNCYLTSTSVKDRAPTDTEC